MVFIACGLNHKSAPLSIREKIAVSANLEKLQEFIRNKQISEGIVLSTCNRIEIYCITNEPKLVLPRLLTSNESLEKILPHIYQYEGEEAINHALRVACGLDSMMLGEPQILGQMKNAYLVALKENTVGEELNNIFSFIFKATKKIRTKSGIGKNPVSVAYAAVQLISKFFKDYPLLNVLIIGSGDTATLVAKHLNEKNNCKFFITGRNFDNTNKLAGLVNGTALPITELEQYLTKYDIIISATSCPVPFITANMVKNATKTRQTPMFFLDLAVPRDIEDAVGNIDNVHLYNVDDLQEIALKGLKKRQQQAIKAEEIIQQELIAYMRTKNYLKAKAMICDYRVHMQELAQEELARALKKLSNGECQYKVITEFSERLVNKLTHAPTVGLREAASDNQQELLDLAQYLFKTSTSTIQ